MSKYPIKDDLYFWFQVGGNLFKLAKVGQVDSTWFVLPTCLAGVHGELHGCSRSRVSGAGYPPSIHVD